jgi:tetratricopeptide (TPR) repeat protein
MALLAALQLGMAAGAGRLLSPSTHETLARSQGLLEAGKARAALEELKGLVRRIGDDPYARAVVQQNLGYAYHVLGREREAIASYGAALKAQSLPEEVAQRVRYTLAQLLLGEGAYREGLQHLERWLRTESDPPAESRYLAAVAHYELGQCRDSIAQLEQAVARVASPPESWYRLLLACQYDLSRFRPAAKTLERLIRIAPGERDYWLQLAGVYQRLGRERDALAILELAYRQGRLEGPEILRLARLYLYLEMPYQAARLLERELETGRIASTEANWILLGDSLLQSQERPAAAQALGHAARVSEKGERYLRWGALLYELEDWPGAARALSTALDKGVLKEPGRAQLLLGLAAYRGGDMATARQALKKAARDPATRDPARRWLDYLDWAAALSARP